MAVFGRTLSRRVYPETSRVGDCFGSLGPAARRRQLSQAKQNPHRLASPKCEDARESDRPMGHSRTRNRWLRVPCVRLPRSEALCLAGRKVNGRGYRIGIEVERMQTRSTTLHHHQDSSSGKASRVPSAPGVRSNPEAELIALARSKGQVLTGTTLQRVKETLELRGVTLEQFLTIIRPHFRNDIRNPSGFVIDFARNFHARSKPAVVVVAAPSPGTVASGISSCKTCKGQTLVIENKEIKPCPQCSTPEFRRNWEAREKARQERRSFLTDRRPPRQDP
jgi:hypothetical protein